MIKKLSVIKLILKLVSIFMLLYIQVGVADGPTQQKFGKFKENNELIKPQDYREWVYIGTALTPHSLNGGKAMFPEFHNVYINQSAWNSWKKTGKFSDDTFIAKELVNIGANESPTGKGYFQGDFSGVIGVAVKNKKRFADEPGNWAYYGFDKTTITAKPQKSQSCAACHMKHAETDMVFTQYYPILRAAAPNK